MKGLGMRGMRDWGQESGITSQKAGVRCQKLDQLLGGRSGRNAAFRPAVGGGRSCGRDCAKCKHVSAKKNIPFTNAPDNSQMPGMGVPIRRRSGIYALYELVETIFSMSVL
jgi:hypothetical protein